jgi:hypothetical protein
MPANSCIRRALVPGVVLAATVLATTVLAAPAALAAPPLPVTPSVPAAAQAVAVTIDSAEIAAAPGTVTVTGTVTCTDAVEVSVFGDVAQVQGYDIARDYFGALVQCGTTPTAWTATSFGALRVFLPLPTTVNVTAQYCVNDLLCYTTTASETMTLPATT